jgi:hypothetical protein
MFNANATHFMYVNVGCRRRTLLAITAFVRAYTFAV